MRFEKKHERLLPFDQFISRQLKYAFIALSIIVFSLLIGVTGYNYFEHFSWIDSLLNASMILGGMGPVNTIQSFNGKLFASFYALYSGLVVVAASGILIIPVVHRLFHLFHSDEGKNE
jgi:hypothetical protein